MADADAPGPERRGVLTTLQAGRALAALAVVAYHSAIATQDFAGRMPEGVFRVLERGTFGVDFFFVLSGFIILHAHGRDPAGTRAARAYAWKRLRRIYVPYLPVSLGLIGLYLTLPSLSASGRDWGLLTSLTLIPTGLPPALAAAWTLEHEMLFYALFLASYFVRPFAVVVAAWVGLILLGMLAGLHTPYAAPTLLSLFSPINVEFVAGMLAAAALPRLPAGWALPCIVAGLLGLTAFFGLGVDPAGPLRMSFGFAVALVVLGAARLETQGRTAAPAGLILLGNASYAIYLVHNPLASLGARIAGRFEPLRSWPASLALCIGLGVACGLAYHVAWENPALKRLGRRRGANPGVSPQ
ncbi:acyltransferase family protein [Methylobacterium sp. sgz302541]|uniref:acyltransferase family protein n=1 Tax=unclassified Methylobacterium TaxID=2615210 RepID=UPI003D352950